MENVEISRADKEDVGEVAAVFSEFSVSTLSNNRLKNLFNLYPAAVAKVGQQLVGFVYCDLFCPDILVLSNIFVVKACRSKGLGTRLLKFIEGEAFETYRGIILVNSQLFEVRETKRFAKNFYEKNKYNLLMATNGSHVYGKLAASW